MNKAIFVGGTGRSGVSVTGRIIAKHPKTFNFGETRFMIDSGGLRRIMKSKNPISLLKRRTLNSLSVIRKNCEQLKPIYTKKAVSKLFNKDGKVEYIIVKFFDMGLEYVDKSIMIEKTPHNVEVADLLFNIFPGFRFIHVFRNPLDVYASVKPLFWGPSNIKSFVKWYNRIITNANIARKRIPKKNYLIVKLEDLVLKQEANVDKISKFLNIKLGNKSIKIIDKIGAHIDRYKHELTPEEITEINNKCKVSYKKWDKLYKKQ